MNRVELEDFLRNRTIFEEDTLRASLNKNREEPLSTSILLLDENSIKKYPFLNEQLIDGQLINPEKTFETTLLHPGEGIIFSCHPRFGSIPEHRHNYIEMTYVYSGECHQIVNGKHIIMNKGEVCILDTNVLHSIKPAGEDDIIINCLMSKKHLDNILLGRLSGNDLLSSFFIKAIYQSSDSNDYILFNSGKSERVAQLMEAVLCEHFDKSLCSDEVINSYMIIIFSELLRIFEKDINTKNSVELKSTKVSDIILYVQNNCKNATLATTAEHFHFHPNYLSSTIKKYTGRKFTDILQEAKLKKASLLLKNSNISIVDIASEVGYENTNYFYEIFKKYYDCSPTEYRKKV